MAGLLTDESVRRTYMIPDFASPEEVTALFERFRRLSLDADRVVFCIALEGRVIGFLNEVHREGTEIELGYVIHPGCRNRGYATEALTAVIGALFAAGFTAVRAGAFEENPASMRVMEKSGMTRTGETEIIPYRGRDHRCICYALRRPESFPAEASADWQRLSAFWNEAFALPKGEFAGDEPAEDWRELAPARKLSEAAQSLGGCRRVLDYGCGSGWASVIIARAGCPEVTAADTAPNSRVQAERLAALYGAGDSVRALTVSPDWLGRQSAGQWDGFFCSNVLDVIPPEMAQAVLRDSARLLAPGARAVISLNHYMDPETIARRGLECRGGNQVFIDGVLRLVSRTDEEWAALLAPCYEVERLDHFAWPGEDAERRRLFLLHRRA